MSLKILQENNYLPSMIFYYWKSLDLFKIHFGHKNFVCWPIFKILQVLLGQIEI